MFVAGDCSDNAKRRIRSRAVSADIPLIEVEHGKDKLGAALGKTSCSTVAITDAGLALLALEHIDTKGEHEEIKRKLKTIKEGSPQRQAVAADSIITTLTTVGRAISREKSASIPGHANYGGAFLVSSLFKYRVHEVAKDFGLTSMRYRRSVRICHGTQNHMQVLTDDELNLIFDYMTLNNQVESIESVFSSMQAAKDAIPTERSEEATAPAAEPEKAAQSPDAPKMADTPARAAGDRAAATAPALKEAAAKKSPEKHRKQHPNMPVKAHLRRPFRSEPQQTNKGFMPQARSRIIDTRGSVDLSKYDEAIENQFPSAQASSRKQKIKKQSDIRSQSGDKPETARKNRKMRKLALERQKTTAQGFIPTRYPSANWQ